MNQTTFEIKKIAALFNVHEYWGIAITFIYFLIGFPSNLLSIIVCCKSLFQNFFLSLTKKRTLKLHNKEFRSSITNNANNKLSNNFNEKAVSLFENFDLNENLLFEESENNTKTKRLNLQRSFTMKSIRNNHNNSIVNLNPYDRYQNQPKARICSNNPHCKCFELFLVEISCCDLIILSYNFIEWVLLILSRLNLIDPIYMEPVLISKFMCRFIIALNRTVILLHNWLVAFMSMTRCYAIYKPFNSSLNFSSKFYFRLNLFVLISLIFTFSLINIYGVSFLSYTRLTDLNSSNNSNATNIFRSECKISNEVYEKYRYIDVYINITLGIIGYSLPCFITLILNLLLIYNIRNIHLLKSEHDKNARKSIVRINESNGERVYLTRSRYQFFKATSSLLTLSFSYLICYIPYSFLFLLMSLDTIKMNVDVVYAFTFLRYLNHTLNFYIYFATGKRFRNDVIEFFRFNKKT